MWEQLLNKKIIHKHKKKKKTIRETKIPVVVLDINTGIEREYASQKEASIAMGVNIIIIQRARICGSLVLKRYKVKAKGTDYIKYVPFIGSITVKETGKTYPNMSSLARDMGVDVTRVRDALIFNRPIKGLHFIQEK